MGYISLQLTAKDAQAVEAFIRLSDAERRALLEAKRLEGQFQTTGQAGKRTGDDVSGGFDIAGLSAGKLMGLLGVGGGVMGILMKIRDEVKQFIQEVTQLGQVADQVMDKTMNAAREMPGELGANKKFIDEMVDWSRKAQAPVLREDVLGAVGAFAKAAGDQGTQESMRESVQSALLQPQRYKPDVFAGIQGTLAQVFGAEALKRRGDIDDLTAFIIEQGPEKAARIQEGLRTAKTAGVAGFSPEETLAWMMAGQETGGGKGIEGFLRMLAEPQQVGKYQAKASAEEVLGKPEMLKQLREGAQLRKDVFGKEISNKDLEEWLMQGLPPEKRREAAFEGKLDLDLILGNKGVLVPKVIEKYKENLAQIKEAEKTDLFARKLKEGVAPEYLEKKRQDQEIERITEKRADEEEKKADLMKLIAAYQEENRAVEKKGPFGLDFLKPDMLTLFETNLATMSDLGIKEISEKELWQAALRSSHEPGKWAKYAHQKGMYDYGTPQQIYEASIPPTDLRSDVYRFPGEPVRESPYLEQFKQVPRARKTTEETTATYAERTREGTFLSKPTEESLQEMRRISRALMEANTIGTFARMLAPIF